MHADYPAPRKFEQILCNPVSGCPYIPHREDLGGSSSGDGFVVTEVGAKKADHLDMLMTMHTDYPAPRKFEQILCNPVSGCPYIPHREDLGGSSSGDGFVVTEVGAKKAAHLDMLMRMGDKSLKKMTTNALNKFYFHTETNGTKSENSKACSIFWMETKHSCIKDKVNEWLGLEKNPLSDDEVVPLLQHLLQNHLSWKEDTGKDYMKRKNNSTSEKAAGKGIKRKPAEPSKTTDAKKAKKANEAEKV
jgi:hypothetical protein